MDDPLQEIQLTREAKLIQRKRGHRTATDDVLCAWAAVTSVPQAGSYLDLGAGHGAVTLMVALALPVTTRGAAVEVQRISWRLLCRNLASNGLDDRITAVRGDLRTANLFDDDRRFELISGSPPFMPLGSGPMPADPQRAGGRFELHGGIEGYADAAARLLSADGRAVLLMDGASERRSRRAFADAGLFVRRSIAVAPRTGAACRYRIYVLAREAGPEAQETLCVRDTEGRWTEAFTQVRATLDLPGR